MVIHTLNIADAVKRALELHKADRLQQAEQIYKSILKDYPDNPDANHLLGVLAYTPKNVSLWFHCCLYLCKVCPPNRLISSVRHSLVQATITMVFDGFPHEAIT